MTRPLGLHISQCRLLRVTARTPHGAVLPSLYPAPLDGILAASARARLLGPDRPVDHHVVDLPLASTRRGGVWANQWVWAATCAAWEGDATDLRHVHQRWDDAAGERVINNLPANTDVGRYKPWRIPVVATVTPELTWWAIGDRDGVAELLDWRVGVGKRRGSGEGVVTDWLIENVGDPDWDHIWWTDAGPARPIPARRQVLTALGLPEDAPTVPHQIRPPYWRAAQTQSSTGGFSRTPREVVAPWTPRPRASTAA